MLTRVARLEMRRTIVLVVMRDRLRMLVRGGCVIVLVVIVFGVGVGVHPGRLSRSANEGEGDHDRDKALHTTSVWKHG